MLAGHEENGSNFFKIVVFGIHSVPYKTKAERLKDNLFMLVMRLDQGKALYCLYCEDGVLPDGACCGCLEVGWGSRLGPSSGRHC